MKKYSVEQRGRSMIEMLGVLAIVGVLSVAGIAGYSKAMGKFKINKAMDQVSTLAANIKTMYASVGTYDTLDDAQAFKLALFPDEMVRGCDSTSFTSAFLDFLISTAHADDTATTVTLTELTPTIDCIRNGINGRASVDGNLADFQIAFDGVSKEACSAFVSSEWGGASGYKGLIVTGGTEDIEVTAAASVSDLFNAAANCNDCGNSNCTATWTFY